MKKGLKWSILLISLAVVFAGVAWVVTNRQTPQVRQQQPSKQNTSTAPTTGNSVPLFSLPGYPDNKPISLANYQGKPIFINFWASWCPPCQAETPDLVKAYAKYGDKVQFIGVNLTAQDSLADVTAFIKKYDIKYPVAMDIKGSVAQQYQVLAIPTSIFVNRQGIIIERYVGAIPPQILERYLQRISQ